MDEDGRHPLAFAPGTNEKRRTEVSPRRTSLHRRTEGHGVYFCRVAATVAGQKACGFYPGPRISLFFSPRLSLFPFSPAAFPRISLLVPRFRPPRSPSSFLPFRHGGLSRSFFSLPATPLFMPPHSPGSSLSRARFPLHPTRAIAPSLFLSFSTVLPPPLLLPNSTTSVAFSPIVPVSLPL